MARSLDEQQDSGLRFNLLASIREWVAKFSESTSAENNSINKHESSKIINSSIASFRPLSVEEQAHQTIFLNLLSIMRGDKQVQAISQFLNNIIEKHKGSAYTDFYDVEILADICRRVNSLFLSECKKHIPPDSNFVLNGEEIGILLDLETYEKQTYGDMLEACVQKIYRNEIFAKQQRIQAQEERPRSKKPKSNRADKIKIAKAQQYDQSDDHAVDDISKAHYPKDQVGDSYMAPNQNSDLAVSPSVQHDSYLASSVSKVGRIKPQTVHSDHQAAQPLQSSAPKKTSWYKRAALSIVRFFAGTANDDKLAAAVTDVIRLQQQNSGSVKLIHNDLRIVASAIKLVADTSWGPSSNSFLDSLKWAEDINTHPSYGERPLSSDQTQRSLETFQKMAKNPYAKESTRNSAKQIVKLLKVAMKRDKAPLEAAGRSLAPHQEASVDDPMPSLMVQASEVVSNSPGADLVKRTQATSVQSPDSSPSVEKVISFTQKFTQKTREEIAEEIVTSKLIPSPSPIHRAPAPKAHRASAPKAVINGVGLELTQAELKCAEEYYNFIKKQQRLSEPLGIVKKVWNKAKKSKSEETFEDLQTFHQDPSDLKRNGQGCGQALLNHLLNIAQQKSTTREAFFKAFTGKGLDDLDIQVHKGMESIHQKVNQNLNLLLEDYSTGPVTDSVMEDRRRYPAQRRR